MLLGFCLHHRRYNLLVLQVSGDRISEAGPEYECLVSFMEAANELGQVKNQTILTKIPGLRKIPGHLKNTYDLMDEKRADLKKYFLTENKVGITYDMSTEQGRRQLVVSVRTYI